MQRKEYLSSALDMRCLTVNIPQCRHLAAQARILIFLIFLIIPVCHGQAETRDSRIPPPDAVLGQQIQQVRSRQPH